MFTFEIKINIRSHSMSRSNRYISIFNPRGRSFDNYFFEVPVSWSWNENIKIVLLKMSGRFWNCVDCRIHYYYSEGYLQNPKNRSFLLPIKATVKSPVLVAVIAVRWESNVRTGSWTTGNSPPNGVFTSKPQKSSPIWVNLVLIQLRLGDIKSNPRDPTPEKERERSFFFIFFRYIQEKLLA